ncbi:MAG TPA: TIM barrel protein [bacterium]|nr:TIM barrel protein [bacterium]HPP11200.1 TIM barrel protein [bacterium]
MRLGGPLLTEYATPEEWVRLLKESGYSAAYCPVGLKAETALVRAYREAARKHNLVIGEVGAWSNPLSSNSEESKKAREKCIQSLALAEEIGACCCVNISGSRGETWDGHHPLNLTKETFELIVEVVRQIIDAVKPVRTCYTLETMPWMYPDSTESYQALLRAIDRKAFAVHFDPTNLINSPWRYYHSGQMIREFIQQLGPYIRSCHAKDIIMGQKLTLHLKETRPGLGQLDYAVFLKELNKLGPDMPLMLEHLPTRQAYHQAASYIWKTARQNGVFIH